MARMAPAPETPVTRWFGPHFDALHPLLRDLHRHGGRLRGEVAIDTGRGVGGVIGQRIARALGVPIDRARRGFEVAITHTDTALHWRRRFEGGAVLESVFVPIGAWPDGYWIETTGPVRLHLAVDVVDGAWRWRALRAYVRGVRMPMGLLPRTSADKAIVDGRYVFHVDVALPGVGHVLGYRGALEVAS